MIRQIFASALYAGLAAGALAFLLQYQFINPLIAEAELYESGARAHFAASLDGPVQSPAGLEMIELQRDFARDAQSFGFSLLTYTGFALILVAVLALADRFAGPVSPRLGLAWGIAAFAAFQLAPGFGLPPELPGMIATEIGPRQNWWIACAAATAIGLALVVFGRGLVLGALGLILIAAPHIWGAPHPDTYFGIVPPELAARFVASVYAVSAAAFATLGLLATSFYVRFDRP